MRRTSRLDATTSRLCYIFRGEASSNQAQLSSYLSNVRKVWNSVFPNEKLEFKHYGYHDAKGLLADMAVVEQVGKSQKYVLKVGKGGKVSSPSRSFTQHGSSVPPRWNLPVYRAMCRSLAVLERPHLKIDVKMFFIYKIDVYMSIPTSGHLLACWISSYDR